VAVVVEVAIHRSTDWGDAEVNLAALILAAGASSRMGSPKALLRLGGETFAERLVRVFKEAGCSTVILVLGHEADEIRAALPPVEGVTVAVNPDYGRGQLSSLQSGLAALPGNLDGFLFTPVDHPAVRPSTVARIVERFEFHSGEMLVIPRMDGRGGHPVCCPIKLVPEFVELAAGGKASDVVRRHCDSTAFVDVEDPGIHMDVDDPEGYRRIMEVPLLP